MLSTLYAKDCAVVCCYYSVSGQCFENIGQSKMTQEKLIILIQKVVQVYPWGVEKFNIQNWNEHNLVCPDMHLKNENQILGFSLCLDLHSSRYYLLLI